MLPADIGACASRHHTAAPSLGPALPRPYIPIIHRCPRTGLGRVDSGGIYELQHRFGGTRTHVLQKALEGGVPAGAEDDTASAALKLAPELRIATGILQLLPGAMGRTMLPGGTVTMNRQALSGNFTMKAPTACRAAPPHVAPIGDRGRAAIAGEQPLRAAPLQSVRIGHAVEATTAFARHIDTNLSSHAHSRSLSI